MPTLRTVFLSTTIFALLALPASAQTATPVCDLFSDAEVEGVLGSVKQKQPIIGPDSCTWSGDGVALTVMRAPGQERDTIAAMLDAVKARGGGKDVAKEEPGVGDRAVSEVAASGGRVTVMAAKGNVMWNFTVEHVYRRLKGAEVLPGLLALAKKATGSL